MVNARPPSLMNNVLLDPSDLCEEYIFDRLRTVSALHASELVWRVDSGGDTRAAVRV